MSTRRSAVVKPLSSYKAVLFDLDGVLTPTIVLHREAWHQLFESVLPSTVASYTDADYFAYVDGKPRYDGVAALLKSRNIEVPWGNPSDSVQQKTVCGYGNRKNAEFERLLREQGILPYDDVCDVLRHLKAAGVKTAVVSSSRNACEVLESSKIIRFFDAVVDGRTRAEQELAGKPAPDTYIYGATILGVDPRDAVVVEDALSGVAAGAAGSFGLVVGVDRGAGQEALLESGADIVVNELGEMLDFPNDSMRIRDTGSTESNPFVHNDPLDRAHYPIDPWSLIYCGEPNQDSATIFSVANGNIGIRGAGDTVRCLGSGTFLSGFHETYALHYAEDAYGYARVGQVMQGVPDATDFHFIVNGIYLDKPVHMRQRLDFRDGSSVEHKEFVVDGNSANDPSATLQINITRRVCLDMQNLVLVCVDLQCEHATDVIVTAQPNVDVGQAVHSDDPRKSEHASDAGLHHIDCWQFDSANDEVNTEIFADATFETYQCESSGMAMAMGFSQIVDGKSKTNNQWSIHLEAGISSRIVRFVAYHTYPLAAAGVNQGLRLPEAENQDPNELVLRCAQTLHEAKTIGEHELIQRQRQWLARFWDRADIQVDAGNDLRVQQIIHWELFQLAQSTAFIPNGVPAKGLSGSGYSGHYFWDTEIYVVPFLTYTCPKLARKALSFRYRMLPVARKHAAALSIDGALYPWRTINGEEGSAFFPAGSAQYHIDADTAFAVTQYVAVSGDRDFLLKEGIDILVETARMWVSLGNYGPDKLFHINCVTGPDEYSALVDDNYYTNAMAQFNLESAVQWLKRVKTEDPESMAIICRRLHITPDEPDQWSHAARSMTLLEDETGLHLQNSTFMNREPWDFKHNTARPLLLHYHPMVIYRHKVLKQTDMVLTTFLLSSKFTQEQKRRDFDFYDALTTGDSTLSASSQAVVAAEVGHADLAMRYFLQALYTDVANLHANTSDGIHLASAGGVWLTLVAGFGGLRDSGGTQISINPHLPDEWAKMTYRLIVSGAKLQVTITHGHIEVVRLEGNPVSIEIQGNLRRI